MDANTARAQILWSLKPGFSRTLSQSEAMDAFPLASNDGRSQRERALEWALENGVRLHEDRRTGAWTLSRPAERST